MAELTTHYTSLATGDGAFAQMIGNFSIVTVMDATVYDYKDACELVDNTDKTFKKSNAYSAYAALKTDADKKATEDHKYLCKLETLKVANITQEGPTKTVTGGKYANTLVKYGKTARLEMQDALGNAEAIEALCGGLVEYHAAKRDSAHRIGLHIGSDFSGPKTMLLEGFFIDATDGKQVDVAIILYQVNPDSIFNMTQDAEGDATVFDMNGDLLTTEILVGAQGEDGLTEVPHGVFYSIIDPKHKEA